MYIQMDGLRTKLATKPNQGILQKRTFSIEIINWFLELNFFTLV